MKKAMMIVLAMAVVVMGIFSSTAMAGDGNGDDRPLMMVDYSSYFFRAEDGTTKIGLYADCENLKKAIIISNGKVVQIAKAAHSLFGDDNEGKIYTNFRIDNPGNNKILIVSFVGVWPFIKICYSELEVYIPEIDVYADAQINVNGTSIDVTYHLTRNFSSAPNFFDDDEANIMIGNTERKGYLSVVSSYDAEIRTSFSFEEYGALAGYNSVRTNFEINGLRFAPDVYYSEPYPYED